MILVGMRVMSGRGTVDHLLYRLMANVGTTLKKDKRLITRPVGTRGYEIHVSKVIEGWPVGWRLFLNGRIKPDQVEQTEDGFGQMLKFYRANPQVFDDFTKIKGVSEGKAIVLDPVKAFEDEVARLVKEESLTEEQAADKISVEKPELFDAYNKTVSKTE